MNFLLYLLFSFFLSLFFTRCIIYFNEKYGFFENIRDDRWHKNKVGKFGGIAIVFSFLITTFIFIEIESHLMISILCTTSFLIGLIDDIFDIKPQIKMLYIILIQN